MHFGKWADGGSGEAHEQRRASLKLRKRRIWNRTSANSSYSAGESFPAREPVMSFRGANS